MFPDSDRESAYSELTKAPMCRTLHYKGTLKTGVFFALSSIYSTYSLLKVIGGSSTCAEKVPWNVLIELTSDSSRASGSFPLLQ